MKLKQILEGAATVGSVYYPPLAAAIPLINAFLPNDEKLSEVATLGEVNTAIDKLPHDVRQSLYEADIDLEKTEILEFTKIQTMLNEADNKGSSTRPSIALGFPVTISGGR